MPNVSSQPTRVLHVVWSMNLGGLEILLMQLLRSMDRERFAFDILIQSQDRPHFADEIESLGCRLISGPPLSRPAAFAQHFRKIHRTHGPYDVLHCHLHRSAAPVLMLGKALGIPVRIAHSHNDLRDLDVRKPWLVRCAQPLARTAIRRSATHAVAVSQRAAASLYGPHWQDHSHVELMPCGINFSPFHQSVDSQAIRKSFNLPDQAWVIGHVGRFAYAKNHAMLLRIARATLASHPNAYFVFVGDGPLFQSIRQQIAEEKLDQRIILTGNRDDVPALMAGLFDAFVFPSIHEGLGIVLVEAQAAGLPCVVADTVPQEACVLPNLYQTLSLDAAPQQWAEQLQATWNQRMPGQQALKACEESHFALHRSTDRLASVYAASRAA